MAVKSYLYLIMVPYILSCALILGSTFFFTPFLIVPIVIVALNQDWFAKTADS